MTELDTALHLEVLFQTFRRAHGIGDGKMHRARFLDIMHEQAEQDEERKKIKVVYS